MFIVNCFLFAQCHHLRFASTHNHTPAHTRIHTHMQTPSVGIYSCQSCQAFIKNRHIFSLLQHFSIYLHSGRNVASSSTSLGFCCCCWYSCCCCCCYYFSYCCFWCSLNCRDLHFGHKDTQIAEQETSQDHYPNDEHFVDKAELLIRHFYWMTVGGSLCHYLSLVLQIECYCHIYLTYENICFDFEKLYNFPDYWAPVEHPFKNKVKSCQYLNYHLKDRVMLYGENFDKYGES